MKNVMMKTTFREIKSSFGRWAAILAIVALGVGFFCGLKMCKDDFVKTGDDYINRLNLYNYQLMTTLGLEDADVDIIAETPGPQMSCFPSATAKKTGNTWPSSIPLRKSPTSFP